MPYKDPEKRKEYAKKRYRANREAMLQYARENYYNNWDAKQEYRNKWIADNPDKVKEYKKKYFRSSKGKAAMSRSFINWLGKNPEKHQAHYAVHNAIRRGDLTKADLCETCSTGGTLHGHHYMGYNKEHQLTVKWLCPSCHKGEHSD